MRYRSFKKINAFVAAFVSATVAIAVVNNNIILALAGILIGLLFIFLMKKATKAILVDERIQSISGKAAWLTYRIATIVMAFMSLVFIMIGKKSIPPQSSIEMLGVIFSYVTLFNLALYSITYKYLSKKYGEADDE